MSIYDSAGDPLRSRENDAGPVQIQDGDHREGSSARRIAERSAEGTSGFLDRSTSTDYEEVHPYRMLFCRDYGHPRRVQLRCGKRSCGVCRLADFKRIRWKYREEVRKMRFPCMVTITEENMPVLTKEVLDTQRRKVRALLKQDFYRGKIRGGLIVLEVTNLGQGKGWHPHTVMLADMSYIEHSKLQADLVKAGLGKQCRIDSARKYAGGVDGMLNYCLKYLHKAPKISQDRFPENEVIYNRVMRGRRLCQPFGSLYRVSREREGEEEEERVACATCGCTAWVSGREPGSHLPVAIAPRSPPEKPVGVEGVVVVQSGPVWEVVRVNGGPRQVRRRT